MIPPAWSSLPATGLNFVSTKPSLIDTSFFTQYGYVPSPDCLSTFGLLGALASASTVHFGVPVPVTPAVQPFGTSPALSASKLTFSARTMEHPNVNRNATANLNMATSPQSDGTH